MNDLDITRAIVRQPSIASKCALIIRDGEDEIVVDALSSYGEVHPRGMNFLFSRLHEAVRTTIDHSPALLLDSLQDLNDHEQQIRDESRGDILYHQFVYGRLADEKVTHPVPGEARTTVIRREITNACQKAISAGHCNIVIHGGLGAGKTVATLQAANHYIENGYRVYKVNNRRSPIQEIDQVTNIDDSPIVLIFDNYHRYLTEIEHYAKTRRQGDILIIAERTQKHDLHDTFLERVLGFKFTEVSVDRLSFDELVDLDRDLNFCGLWREYAGWRQGARIRFAQETLSASMSRILLDVVRSRDIKDRVETEIGTVLNDPDAVRLFVAALIINTLQYDFWIRDWQVFFSVRDLQKVLQHKDSISNFINLSSSQWTTNSSLLSSELLRNVISNREIVSTLVEIYRRAEGARSHDREMYLLKIDLMRYANIEQVINEKGKAQALREYYQRIRSIGDTADNSDYWLQYGMALSIHGYLGESDTIQEAEVAFQNAYKREEAKRDPNTRRIDNYYSRFQLQKAVVIEDHVEAAKIFSDASQKLVRQVFDEEARHYPFKVGRLFTDIAVAHYDGWSEDARKRFRARCAEMVRYGEERLTDLAHKQISLMVNDISSLLEKLDTRGAKDLVSEELDKAQGDRSS